MIRFSKMIILLVILSIIGIAVIIHLGNVKIPAINNDKVDRRLSSLYINKYDDTSKDQGWFGSTKPDSFGDTIMPRLGNATIKAELGRASWRLIHTVAARFPVKPTQEEQKALNDFIYLFSRLYPCGECANHFQAVLVDHPPKVNSRKDASQWACEVHNIVNQRLSKDIFNCSEVLSHWKCGCADAED